MERKRRNGVTSLTDREQEILQLIWNGLKNREIGTRLKISVKTVEAHRANMMKKLRVSNAAQLLKAAIEEGFIRVRRGWQNRGGVAAAAPRTARPPPPPRRWGFALFPWGGWGTTQRIYRRPA